MNKPVLLVVDDDPQVLAAVRRDLRSRYREHYTVMSAASGQEAVVRQIRSGAGTQPRAQCRAGFREGHLSIMLHASENSANDAPYLFGAATFSCCRAPRSIFTIA